MIEETGWSKRIVHQNLHCIDLKVHCWLSGRKNGKILQWEWDWHVLTSDNRVDACFSWTACAGWHWFTPLPPFLYKLWQTDKGFKGWRKVHRLLSGGDRGGRVLWVSPKTGADSTQTSATSAAAAQWDLDRWTQEMSSFRNPTRVPWTHSGVGSMGKVLSVLTRMANNFSLSGGLLGECFSRPFCYCDLWNVGSPELIPKIKFAKNCEKKSPDWHWLNFIGTIVVVLSEWCDTGRVKIPTACFWSISGATA